MNYLLGLLMKRALPSVVVLCITASAVAQQFQDQTATRFPSPNPAEWTNQLTLGDIDGDGDLDILFANGGNFSTPGTPLPQRIFINDGSGHFTDESAARINFLGLCRGVELGDIDRDGDLDVIYAQDFQRQPQLFENNGKGFFTSITSQLPQMTLSSSRAQFGDIDNDGDLDIYITSGSTNRFGCGQYRVYVNDGTGSYTDETAARHPIENICENMDCIFGDIDRDLDLDVKTSGTGNNNSRLYENDGTGVFSLLTTIPSDTTCYSYDFGDIDGDGDLDLIGANGLPGSSSEILLMNTGGGTFVDISSQISPNPNQDDNDSKFLDYDNDGDLDLIIARLGTGGEKIYQNDGAGGFTLTSGVIQVVTDSSLDIAVGDLNGDGRLDIVTAQGESGTFQNRIYMNTTGPADTIAPRIIKAERLFNTADTTGPYVVRAMILDDMSSDRNFFSTGASVHYTVDGGPDLTVPMVYSGGPIYRGAIPGQPCGGLIQYSVSCTDFAGNTGSSTFSLFTVTGPGSPPGDLNQDCTVDPSDSIVFVAVLLGQDTDPVHVAGADLDGSGMPDGGDIQPFVSLLVP
ncbi:MAG: FG-GAP repeat domain-containing protein [Phycisphaerae bacterium]